MTLDNLAVLEGQKEPEDLATPEELEDLTVQALYEDLKEALVLV